MSNIFFLLWYIFDIFLKKKMVFEFVSWCMFYIYKICYIVRLCNLIKWKLIDIEINVVILGKGVFIFICG